MTRQDLIVRALQEILNQVDPELAKQIQIEVSQQQGQNQLHGHYGIGNISSTDIKLNKDQLEPIMVRRLEQEVALTQEAAGLAEARGDEREKNRLNAEVNRLNGALENVRRYGDASMYADVGFRYDKAKGTYTYIYDKDYDQHKASGFGKTFADEVARAYACLEQLEELPSDLNAVQDTALYHTHDDVGNPAVVAEVSIDSDTLVRLGLLQTQSNY
jgi:hypothetical protein